MSELLEKLACIQKKLKAPKSQYNSFGKYSYRNCEDILEAVKPLLDGVTLTIYDEIVLIGERYYIKATVALEHISVEKGYQSKVITAYAREEYDKKGMDASQITGSASSYARKYALNGLFLIDDTKDADATNKHEDKPKPKPQENKEDVTDFDEKGAIKTLKGTLNSKMGSLSVSEKKDFYAYATQGKETVDLLNHIISDFDGFFEAWKKQRDDAA